MKFKVFFESVWNIWDTFAILVFSAAVIVRNCPVTPKAARMIYVVNIVFWYMRILEILSVNKYLGPYVKIISKFLRDMSYFVIIVFIVVMSFGIVRQAIHYQDEEWSWFLVRNMFFYPYWMIYGELFADEIDTCTDPARSVLLADGEIDFMCVYGSWISPLLMCIYLLIVFILCVNLLIARFNTTFAKNNAHSREIWKFQRYQLIINYELRPILPPPLIFLNHIYLALKFIKRRCQGKRDTFDSGLKLFLSHDDMEKLHDFEEECAEDYFREKDIRLQSSSDKRIQVINERVENISMRWEDMSSKDNSIKLSLQGVDYRLSVLEEIAVQNKEILGHLKSFMSHYDVRSRNASASSDKSSTRVRLDSEDSIPDNIDLQTDTVAGPGARDNKLGLGGESSLTDSSSSTMRSMPSPILVHSRKTHKDENLQKFTDYSKSPSKSNHAITRRLERQSSVKQRRSLPKVLEQDSTTPTEEIKPSLSERRHATNLHIETNLSVPDYSFTCANLDLSDHGETEVNNSTAVYSTAHMITDTQVSTDCQGRRDYNENAPGLLMKSKSYDSPLTVQVPVHSAGGTNDYATFTPILTSLRAEYTTITDVIDTTCMINRSPPRSPTSAHPYNAEGMWDDFKHLTETATLKQAEEQESRRMGKVIRKRLRQISMDESDSISDLAKLAISEMDVTDDVQSEHEDDDIQGSDENVPHIMKEAERSHEDSGPVTFNAIEIKIRRASTQDGEGPYEEKA